MKLETFFEKFDQFADAPDAVAKMRELILRLAMQGKISRPRDNDVPVNVLLSAIEKERESLGVQSSCKSFWENREAPDVKISGGIPARWAWVHFGEIAKHNAGKTLDKGRNTGQLRDYITTSNLYWGFFQMEEVRQMPIRDEELERCTAKKGDLLICEGGEAGRAAVWPHDYEISFQNHVHRARFYGRISPYYVQRYFEKLNATEEINKYRKGVGISNMSGKALASIPIPLPPLAEQKRIVAKVDELMALCDQLEAQQQERDTRRAALARASLTRFADAPTPANLNFLFHKSYDITPADLRKSIYQAAFDGKLTGKAPLGELPNALPAGWVEHDVASLCVIEDGDRGSAYPKKADFSEAGHCVFLNTKNVRPHGFDFTTLEWISEEKHDQLRKGTLIRGDIVFTSRGTIGNIAHYDDSVPFDVMRINSGMFILRGFQKHMEASFLSRLLRSPQIRTQIESLRSGSAQPQLPIREFRKFSAKIPPLAEQRRIVAKVDQLMALVDELENHLAASRTTAKNLLEALVAELTAAGAPSLRGDA
jgi:type I restriction enzyme S subunit